MPAGCPKKDEDNGQKCEILKAQFNKFKSLFINIF